MLPRLLDSVSGRAQLLEPLFAAYLKTAKGSPADAAVLKRELSAVGYLADTISGDVVTGWFDLARLGRLLDVAWVESLQPPASVTPR